MRRPRLLALGVTAALLVVAAPAAARPLDLGYFDAKFNTRGIGPALWSEVGQDRADRVRITLAWSNMAPTRPRDPTDPRDPAYRWSWLDSGVAAARAQGAKVLLVFSRAPAWAEAPGRDRSAARGTWRPDPAATGQFAQALATRYRGQVDAYEVWNEPNLTEYLAPQWVVREGRPVPAGAHHYRAMLNAAYAGVRAADPGALVVSGGLSPEGETAGGPRTAPLLWWRELTAAPVSLDVAAHHPYQFFGPAHRGPVTENAGVADVGRISALVARAGLAGRVLPAGPKRTWVTEFSWDSAPDPRGLPPDLHARWLEYSLFSLWTQGVDTVLWYQVRDSDGPDPRTSFQSGTRYADGRPKPALLAFRFPFITAPEPRGRAGRAWGRSRARVQVWGRAPVAGRLVVERLVGNRWRAVLARRVRRGEVFHRRGLRLGPGTIVRARVEDRASLPWAAGRERLR